MSYLNRAYSSGGLSESQVKRKFDEYIGGTADEEQITCTKRFVFDSNEPSQVKLSTGASPGYVLTSDEVGNASWQPIPIQSVDQNDSGLDEADVVQILTDRGIQTLANGVRVTLPETVIQDALYFGDFLGPKIDLLNYSIEVPDLIQIKVAGSTVFQCDTSFLPARARFFTPLILDNPIYPSESKAIQSVDIGSQLRVLHDTAEGTEGADSDPALVVHSLYTTSTSAPVTISNTTVEHTSSTTADYGMQLDYTVKSSNQGTNTIVRQQITTPNAGTDKQGRYRVMVQKQDGTGLVEALTLRPVYSEIFANNQLHVTCNGATNSTDFERKLYLKEPIYPHPSNTSQRVQIGSQLLISHDLADGTEGQDADPALLVRTNMSGATSSTEMCRFARFTASATDANYGGHIHFNLESSNNFTNTNVGKIDFLRNSSTAGNRSGRLIVSTSDESGSLQSIFTATTTALTINEHILPSENNTLDIGNSSEGFRDIRVRNVVASQNGNLHLCTQEGNIRMGITNTQIGITLPLRPSTSGTTELGSSSLMWSTTHTNNVNANNILRLQTDSGSRVQIEAGAVRVLVPFTPQTNGSTSLGTSLTRFSGCFLTTNVDVSSDERLKKDISPLNLGLDFVRDI